MGNGTFKRTLDESAGTAIKVDNKPDVISSPGVRAFYDYWRRLRGARRFPSRADIDPVDIPRFLSGILLLSVHYDPLDFEYRIIGEEIVMRLGDMTGKRVREAALINMGSSAYRNYCAVIESGQPQFLEGATVTAFRKDRPCLLSRVHCPLSPDDRMIDWIISYVSFL